MSSEQIEVTRLSGQDAQDFMNQVLMDVAGASTLEEANTILVGRPRLGQKKDAVEYLHCKVTPEFKQEIVADAASQKMSLSDYMRECFMLRHRQLQLAGN